MRRRRRKKPLPRKGPNYRINRRIRVPKVQVVDQNGVNHGTISTDEAKAMAQEAGLDLVEVSPNAKPPVCRIMDYGKFSYNRTKKERAARKQQKTVETKTIQLSIDTAEFHRDIKVRNARKWLESGKKVKVAIRFFGREITRPQLGRDVMDTVFEQLKDVSTIEQKPNLEGRRMIMLLTPE